MINDCSCRSCSDSVINAGGLSAHLRRRVMREVKMILGVNEKQVNKKVEKVISM